MVFLCENWFNDVYLLQEITLTTVKVILAVAHYFVKLNITAFFVFETLIKGCAIRIS